MISCQLQLGLGQIACHPQLRNLTICAPNCRIQVSAPTIAEFYRLHPK